MMNYAQLTEQIEQMNGKKSFDNFEAIFSYFQTEFEDKSKTFRVLDIPCTYAFDMTGEYLEKILKELGYVTGRFHYYAIKPSTGCIMWKGKAISRKDYTYYGNKAMENLPAMEKRCLKGKKASKMELLFFAALFFYLEKKCDYVILPKEDVFCEEGISYSRQDQTCLNMALEILKEQKVTTDEKKQNRAVKKCICKGHFELLKKNPTWIIDGADDEQSIKILLAKLQYQFPDNPYIFVVGCMQEAADEIVQASAVYPMQIITLSPMDMQNAMSSIELGEKYRKLNPNITNAGSVEEAVEIAELLAGKTTVIAAFGTTAILDHFQKILSPKAERL